MLRRSTFDAYEKIIQLCLDERVDALLVAGDVYDETDRSLRAQLKFVGGLERLDEAGIRSFICHGNHDPLDGWQARLDLPRGCVRFGSDLTSAPVFPDEPERATVYGVSYPHRDVRENLSQLFPKVRSGSGFEIGLLHANVGGNPSHESYAPCSIADLESSSIDYWALGHVHTQQVLREQGPTIAYPGNPQGRHPNEQEARGVYLVEVGDTGIAHPEFRAVDVLRWKSLQLDIASLNSTQQLLDAINNLADSALEAAETRSVMFRLTLTGRGPLHGELRRVGTVDDLREQLNERYTNSEPWLWCERIQLSTASPVEREEVMRRQDFVGDLARLREEMQNSPDALAEIQESLQALYTRSSARPFLRDALPSDDEIRELLAAAEDECLDELVGDEDDE